MPPRPFGFGRGYHVTYEVRVVLQMVFPLTAATPAEAEMEATRLLQQRVGEATVVQVLAVPRLEVVR